MPAEKSPRMYDSMAQAFHLIGQHDKAVEAQKMAIHFLGDLDESLKLEMSERLLVYTQAADKGVEVAQPSHRGQA